MGLGRRRVELTKVLAHRSEFVADDVLNGAQGTRDEAPPDTQAAGSEILHRDGP